MSSTTVKKKKSRPHTGDVIDGRIIIYLPIPIKTHTKLTKDAKSQDRTLGSLCRAILEDYTSDSHRD